MKKINWENLTPHTVTICTADGSVVKSIPASGGLARVAVTSEIVGEVDGVPLTESVWGEVTGLPNPVPGTLLIVSRAVAERVPERQDVLIPNGSVRNEQGQVIGCTSLTHISRIPDALRDK